jgi:AAA+ superfamily predicted ATPase
VAYRTRTISSKIDETLFAALAFADVRVLWAVARARAGGIPEGDAYRGLYVGAGDVDALLVPELGSGRWGSMTAENGQSGPWQDELEAAERRWAECSQDQPTRLDQLVQAFALGKGEIDLFLLALLPEIDPRYEQIYAYLQDDVTRKRPTVELLLNLVARDLAEKLALRSLLRATAPLLTNHLLLRFDDPHSVEPPLLSQFVRPDPFVVEWLLGAEGVSEPLQQAARLLEPRRPDAGILAADQRARLETVPSEHPLPLVVLEGGYGGGKQSAALALANAAETPLLVLDIARIATVETVFALALRDARLHDAMLYVAGWEHLNEETARGALIELAAYRGLVAVGTTTPWSPPPRLERPVFRLVLDVPAFQRRRQLWAHYLAETGAPPLDVTAVANQFRFSAGQIRDAAASAVDLARWQQTALTSDELFAASRAHSNQKLGALATKINPRFTWNDIVLPVDTLAQLREMVNTVRHRPRVYHDWGFAKRLALGRGLNALFAGESGTGKTMAVDVMAGELGLELYKIDLSAVVSKYIGETEKNLNQIFHEAETSNAILFFDEADALFGKRSEVRDSHDRYANVEISYLLQRMEAFDGVVILATNLRANLDEAFTRRLHYVVEFPFPEAEDRTRIWQVNVPPDVPLADDVDWADLAQRFRITGGNIRNIILAASFLAAEEESALALRHLLHAARREYQKLGRLIDDTLFVP